MMGLKIGMVRAGVLIVGFFLMLQTISFSQNTVPRTRPDGAIEACDDNMYQGLTLRGNQVFLWVNALSGLNEPGNGPDAQIQMQSIKKIADALQQKNIKLVPVVVPQKELVLREMLIECSFTPYALRLYQSLLDNLKRFGLNSPNLEAEFRASNNRDNLYLHSDFHWDIPAVTLTASLVAKQIQTEAATVLEGLPEVKSSMVLGAPIPMIGPLSERLPEQIRPLFPPDNIRCPNITTEQSGDLLGDKTVGIATVGTSFSLVMCKGLSKMVGLDLSRDVYDYSTPNVGFWDSLYLYLTSKAFQENTPKLLIWEMPAYQFINYPTWTAIKPRAAAEQELLATIQSLP